LRSHPPDPAARAVAARGTLGWVCDAAARRAVAPHTRQFAARPAPRSHQDPHPRSRQDPHPVRANRIRVGSQQRSGATAGQVVASRTSSQPGGRVPNGCTTCFVCQKRLEGGRVPHRREWDALHALPALRTEPSPLRAVSDPRALPAVRRARSGDHPDPAERPPAGDSRIAQTWARGS
jgi:hypothetical protein